MSFRAPGVGAPPAPFRALRRASPPRYLEAVSSRGCMQIEVRRDYLPRFQARQLRATERHEPSLAARHSGVAGAHRLGRRRLAGRRTLLRAAARLRSVHSTGGARRHGRGPVRVRAGLGDAGRPLDAIHRSATTLGGGSCGVHGAGGSSPSRVRLRRGQGAELGVASSPAGLGDLDGHPRPSAAP